MIISTICYYLQLTAREGYNSQTERAERARIFNHVRAQRREG